MLHNLDPVDRSGHSSQQADLRPTDLHLDDLGAGHPGASAKLCCIIWTPLIVVFIPAIRRISVPPTFTLMTLVQVTPVLLQGTVHYLDPVDCGVHSSHQADLRPTNPHLADPGAGHPSASARYVASSGPR